MVNVASEFLGSLAASGVAGLVAWMVRKSRRRRLNQPDEAAD
jgi:hypothetical protein